ncbi:MAG: helix-turn-helix domain-containing protein [Verrucomicrobia bacterium]|nr:helix-turn-helix domain-containing protein [Verrucomicrobiota bacterium]
MTIVISVVNRFLRYEYGVANDQLRAAICANVVRRLSAARRRRRVSMNRLAQLAGLSQSMVSLVERDLRNPTLDTLLRIAHALDVDLADILKRAARAATRGKVV